MRKTDSLTGESGSRSPIHSLMLGEFTGDGSFGSLRGNMEFGVFDHLDRNRSVARRLLRGAAADHRVLRPLRLLRLSSGRASFDADRHGAAPSVFLSAVAQRTSRLRFGPLVYALPLYHPLRLIEEICMLDQMSGGRLEIGFGRGSVPIELEYYGERSGGAQEVYAEALEIVLKGLTRSRRSTFGGKHLHFDNVPMELEPLQKPYPPVWYGVHMPDSAERAARRQAPGGQPRSAGRDAGCRSTRYPRVLGADAARRHAAAARWGSAASWWWRRHRRRGAGAGAARLSGLACELHVSVPPPRPLAIASAARDLRSGDGARAGHRGLAAHGRGRAGRAARRDRLQLHGGTIHLRRSHRCRMLRSIGLFAEQVMPALRARTAVSEKAFIS